MRRLSLAKLVCLYSLTSVLLVTCGSKEQAKLAASVSDTVSEETIEKEPVQDVQIAEYIRHIYQDKKGHFWFGTNGFGVAHYNGDSVAYYSNTQGFCGQQITGITEDTEKNIWFATDQGVVKYAFNKDNIGDKYFINFSDFLYFGGQRFWTIYADSQDRIWAGSVNCIYVYEGQSWHLFDLPYPKEDSGQFITRRTSWSITEDSQGHLWFSTNGYGAFKYDGESFTRYSKEDGLTDNDVDVIIEDKRGKMWFGTRYGGVSSYDGNTFTDYTARNNSIGNDEVCEIFEDSQGNIWMSSEGYGVYRLNTKDKTITNFSFDQGLAVSAVQTIYEDKQGRLWVGGGGGLYRLEGESFINVKRRGPWK